MLTSVLSFLEPKVIVGERLKGDRLRWRQECQPFLLLLAQMRNQHVLAKAIS
jgi:hypothetical protein